MDLNHSVEINPSTLFMLKNCTYWIFDLDGTLTQAQHDFAAIKETLGLPAKPAILEAIADLPPQQAQAITRQLDELELAIAAEAKPQSGALALLEKLTTKQVNIGILTRNSHLNARMALEACAMSHLFDDDDIISRNCANPKPDPDGIHKLLNRWQGHADQTVMVGDFLFDIQCGNRAGATTVYFDPMQQGLWSEEADIVVSCLSELNSRL